MEQMRDDQETAATTAARAPYVRPELKFLGDVAEITRGGAGSAGDMDGRSQPSTIRTKKAVAYLDDSAREAVMRDLLSMRLASWEYIDPSTSGGHRHLGIIIEDNAEMLAVNRGKESIDLYSYASMAVAAVQVQARAMEDLRKELAALRAELAALKKS